MNLGPFTAPFLYLFRPKYYLRKPQPPARQSVSIPMQRRHFLTSSLTAPLSAQMLPAAWKSAPPPSYLGELTALLKAAAVPGMVVGAVRAGKPAWTAPLGGLSSASAAASAAPVTPASLFQAASLTKQLTAHAAHALRASGKLDFDRPLVSYLDDLPHPTARTVTLRHVLSHSSGFPNWRFTDRGKPAPALEPAFPPGSKFQYSGEGYFYLQRILEEVTGQGFGQLLAELVMKPAGMTASTLVWDPATLDRTALPHNRRGEPRQNWDKSARALRDYAARLGKPVEHLRYADYAAFTRDSGDPPLPNWMLPNAAASLVTSASDYARFLAWVLKTPNLDQPAVKMNDSLSWGLGWGIERVGARTFLWQWGDNGGYKNFVLAEPATGDALFVFTNGDSGARLYERVLTRATGMEHPAFFWL
ncbi:MAG: beta-lactamase family protein [Acidobacteria bacterium]|nr:beta-lactamase family protein [Acidobacteriota bacterium]